MLVFPVNGGVRSIGSVSILPIRTEVASDHGKITFPLVLDPLHRGMDGRKFKPGPRIFVTETCDDFTLLGRERRVLKLCAEDDHRTGRIVRTRVCLEKNWQ